MPGVVPLFDEVSACKEAHYQYWGEWQELEGHQKALIVAHYYLQLLVKNHSEDAAITEMEKKSKKGK